MQWLVDRRRIAIKVCAEFRDCALQPQWYSMGNRDPQLYSGGLCSGGLRKLTKHLKSTLWLVFQSRWYSVRSPGVQLKWPSHQEEIFGSLNKSTCKTGIPKQCNTEKPSHFFSNSNRFRIMGEQPSGAPACMYVMFRSLFKFNFAFITFFVLCTFDYIWSIARLPSTMGEVRFYIIHALLTLYCYIVHKTFSQTSIKSLSLSCSISSLISVPSTAYCPSLKCGQQSVSQRWYDRAVASMKR